MNLQCLKAISKTIKKIKFVILIYFLEKNSDSGSFAIFAGLEDI